VCWGFPTIELPGYTPISPITVVNESLVIAVDDKEPKLIAVLSPLLYSIIGYIVSIVWQLTVYSDIIQCSSNR
jgi:hypothetical protein